jgi:hypothetical protein
MIHEDILDANAWLLPAVQKSVSIYHLYGHKQGDFPGISVDSDKKFRAIWMNLKRAGAINGLDSIDADIAALQDYLLRKMS